MKELEEKYKIKPECYPVHKYGVSKALVRAKVMKLRLQTWIPVA